jgi:hypothetical protein
MIKLKKLSVLSMQEEVEGLHECPFMRKAQVKQVNEIDQVNN